MRTRYKHEQIKKREKIGLIKTIKQQIKWPEI